MSANVNTANFDQLTVLIKTFERPKCLERLLISIQQYHPDLRVLVADDSLTQNLQSGEKKKPHTQSQVTYLRLPPDLGIGASRNAMLARVRTPYFLLLNDDLQLHKRTRLNILLEQVASGQHDLVAGELVRCRRKLLFVKRQTQSAHGTMHLRDGKLTLQRGGRLLENGIVNCDLVHPFFVARTDRVRTMGGWDSDLKLDEQEEFFFRAQQFKLRVGMSPEVTALHWAVHQPSLEYLKHRTRSFKSLAISKMGLERLVHWDGETIDGLPSRLAA